MNRTFVKIILLLAFFIIIFFQIRTTNIKTAYQFNPFQIDQQIGRMNSYPPHLAKLGYLMEVKKETQIIKIVISNFFNVISFNEYFPRRIPSIFSPFIFIGLYYFIKEREKWSYLFWSFFSSILVLTIVGPYAKYGPFLMYPFFIFFILICLQKIIILRKK